MPAGGNLSYRDKIYKNYSSNFQDLEPVFDAASARRLGRAYDYYFQGWLPKQKNAAIVDLACGGGGFLFYLKERGFTNISGVDISPSQIAIASQVVPGVVQGSVLDFLHDNPMKFDMISGLDIVEHFTKDEVLYFLEGCHKALKPGGRLILQTPNADSPVGSNIRYGDFTHEVCFNPNSLGRLLKLCGFENHEAREMGPPRRYSFAASMRAALWSLLRFKLTMWNLIETGQKGSGIYTRVFSISASKT